MPKNDSNDIQVEVDPACSKGDYANFVKIQHTAIDFRFDFARVFPDENRMFISSRVFMSPIHAKMFFNALNDNLAKYEKLFGPIELRPEKMMPLTSPPSKEKH